jgi:GUN4-like
MTSSSPYEGYTSVDCTQLEKYMKSGLWRLADQETRKLLYSASGVSPSDQQYGIQINQIPCGDLLALDQLWVKFSKGRFGFSVQQQLLAPLLAKYYSKTEAWNRFGDKVGWRVNHLLKQNYWKKHSELTFTLQAPVGHFPHMGDKFGILTIEQLTQHLEACKNPVLPDE